MFTCLLRRIEELADQGVTIIGPATPPSKSPSLADMGAGDAEVGKLGGGAVGQRQIAIGEQNPVLPPSSTPTWISA